MDYSFGETTSKSKSLDFCLSSVLDPERSSYYDRKWGDAKELDSRIFFDNYLKGERNLTIDGYDVDGNSVSYCVKLTFNPDADFQYFTSDSNRNDGTLIFVTLAMERIVSKVCNLQTYYHPLGEPQSGATIEIEIGNFVVLNEYDEDGTKFTPEDKKWMRERTTVLLPLRMEYK